jgi:SAM-dependent methyltransferase
MIQIYHIHDKLNFFFLLKVPKAIEVATKRTNPEIYPNVTYKVLDILDEKGVASDLGQFDIILDSCLYHGLLDPERIIYMKSLQEILKPGGYLVQLSFSEKEVRERSKGPRKVSRRDLEEMFSENNGWIIESITDDVIESVSSVLDGCAYAYLSIIRRL